jgi:hypothetical protein
VEEAMNKRDMNLVVWYYREAWMAYMTHTDPDMKREAGHRMRAFVDVGKSLGIPAIEYAKARK